MKILAINIGYLQTVPSGGDKHLLEVAAEWSKTEEVTLLIPDFAKPLAHGKLDIQIIRSRIPHNLFDILWIYTKRTFAALYKMRHIPADVVVCSPGLFDLIPARLHSAIHGSVIGCYVFHLAPRRSGGNWTQRLQNAIAAMAQKFSVHLCRGVHCVFTENQHTVDQLCALGISPDRICRQTPVVNAEAVRRAIPLPAPDVLFVGRMVPAKGIFDLLEAIEPLDVTLGYIGNGAARQKLERTLVSRGLESRVTVYGPLPEDRLYGLLRGCRLFVLPSYEEGYGIAIAEAIAAEKPVLAYDLPHYAEVFPGAVMTVPLGDKMALQKKIKQFFQDKSSAAEFMARYPDVKLMSAARAAEEERQQLSSDLPKHL